ncbi:AN1-type zinc finger protein 4-like [Lytechinus variegatus]|uniref:AN1-type zinc finger protein 4-like n=1 Tax=Lytechinus variegatus TaxID=7654 RepID=UPI001BB23802|nr:AN1-type zinc finger protein 4-like [Lytechinus variegatus]
MEGNLKEDTMEYIEYPEYADIMELFIETLTGTVFELRVSPFETVISVKAKIQRLEGIPISQQHLIWRSVELEDDYCLQDYGIPPSASLKLVLAMRGGPINTRRIPMEDPAIREMAEYMEANKEEIWEKLPGNRQVTLLVFREGDQLNFFRVVDRGDGTLTPLSESLSGASVCNVGEEEEEEKKNPPPAEDQTVTEENDLTMGKMKLLRAKMENLSVGKKKTTKTSRPPSSSRPKSSGLRRNFSAKKGSQSLSKTSPLPPVGTTILPPVGGAVVSTGNSNDKLPTPRTPRIGSSANGLGMRTRTKPEIVPQARAADITQIGATTNPVAMSASAGMSSRSKSRTLRLSSSKESRHSPIPPPSSQRALENLTGAKLHHSFRNRTNAYPHPPSTQSTFIQEFRPTTSSNLAEAQVASDASRVPERMNLKTADARMVTQLVNQANREGKINNIVRSGHRESSHTGKRSGHSRVTSGGMTLSHALNSSNGLTNAISEDRIRTPDARKTLISAHSIRGRLSGSKEGRLLTSPAHRLPPVTKPPVSSTKKKASKRCFLCNKKTGLATSYSCRCGHNFCASHRYAEAHNCGYDYKTEGRKLLEQSNPLVSAPKLPKI